MSMTIELDAAGLVELERNHAALLRLCLTLEEISDSIPFDIESAVCLHVAEGLGPLLTQGTGWRSGSSFPTSTRMPAHVLPR
ncbi:MAG: hypothetical protein KJ670_18535 [Alphaproteobacteria bacterium]|nr:hypothetical protein [Alphaproteobacteria bacterium]MBU4090712.1 hypothetical protein [Alphaproteobacteria bacterium]